MSRVVVAATAFALTLALVACGGAGKSAIAPPATPPASPAPSPVPPTASPGIVPTTTLAAETRNNTSTADNFARQTNGNAGAANVSKLPLRSLLYGGATSRIYVNLLPWFGGPSHLDVGYRSDDPAQVRRQVEDMISRGIQGAIITWFGPNATVVNAATMAVRQEAEAHPGFEFAIMEDGGALVDAAIRNGCNVTDQLISDLNYVAGQYQTSPAYLRMQGRPVVFFFGVDAFYIDWDRVRSSVGNNPVFLFRGTQGFSHSVATGGYQWVDINSRDPFDPQLAAQDAFYSGARSTPARVAFGSAYKGFDDTLAEWGTNRFIQQRCGQTWLATFAEIAKFYSADNQLPAVQVVTWNDYEEGTAIEPGVDNCIFLAPSIAGNTLNWTVEGGGEASIDHYTVFISTDGQNLTNVGDVAVGTHSFDLSKLGLSPATYTVFIKAVGRPSFLNKMSPGIAYRPGNQPPVAALTVSQTGELTVSASTGGSSDADGSIAGSQIDFGDGTVLSGVSASHTYAVVGTYNITATVTDTAGASAVAIKRTSVKPARAGVTLFEPPPSSTVNWPTRLTASATLASPVTAMKVLVDNEAVYTTDQDSINIALKFLRGTHHVVVQAFDSAGGSATAATDVVAQPGDLTPVATVSLQPLPSVSPLAVLSCTEASRDPDGFILFHQVQFSDGSKFFTPGALHTFAAPGAYSVTATVTDQFGAAASTTQSFSVSGGTVTTGSASSAPVRPMTRQPTTAAPIRLP
jgi:PKD repeat protein